MNTNLKCFGMVACAQAAAVKSGRRARWSTNRYPAIVAGCNCCAASGQRACLAKLLSGQQCAGARQGQIATQIDCVTCTERAAACQLAFQQAAVPHAWHWREGALPLLFAVLSPAVDPYAAQEGPRSIIACAFLSAAAPRPHLPAAFDSLWSTGADHRAHDR